MASKGGITKKHTTTETICGVAKALQKNGVGDFTITAFVREGMAAKTIDYRLTKYYGLAPEVVPHLGPQFRRVFRTADLVLAMKNRGEWVGE